ncbi:hypothetical protein BACT_0017 [Bifidobacterium actinocoloniiforme DSM 22766]|uniref:Uncharacterized protein n=1 Tax=Bifidobacterium actinocoloniiforme DSM 22766 TaxID=1437605 RepID=A0A086YWB3_9BIFI|nr:hypothetical protein AB656_05875 [Bifidobacterium actinocoloniiforme DSM 22766]KFI38563.1 hypothetical protein BACT_0017 [Bifidobacterium actinocoloniiforme DSM 22766]
MCITAITSAYHNLTVSLSTDTEFDFPVHINPVLAEEAKSLLNQWLARVLVFLCLLIIILIIIFPLGYLYDFVRKGKYTDEYFAKHVRTWRLLRAGSEEDLYINYWIWQRYKRKAALVFLSSSCGLNNAYTRHARKRHKDEKSKIPFRESVVKKHG